MISAHPTTLSTLSDSPECWPELRLADWKNTLATIHMWTQIVGKIRLRLTPRVNHWWNVPLYVSPHGLTTSLIPYGNRHFDIEFDFLAEQLIIRASDPGSAAVALGPRSVADFYGAVMAALRSLGIVGIPVKVNGDSSGKPNGVPLKANSRRSEATLAG